MHFKTKCWINTFINGLWEKCCISYHDYIENVLEYACIYQLIEAKWRMHASVDQTIMGSNDGFVAWSAPSHYLNQRWYIVNLALGIKLQWNVDGNPNIFFQENAFENVVCEMAAILSRPQYILI